jgi:sulfur-carrier protein adenylyltransferase/sulfurtransferase
MSRKSAHFPNKTMKFKSVMLYNGCFNQLSYLATTEMLFMVEDLTPKQLKARLDAGEDLMIIDVREAWELEESKMANAILIPMGEISSELDQIPEDKPVVIICRTGSRSSQVADWLQAMGYDELYNLTGGMNQWVTEIDPSAGKPY